MLLTIKRKWCLQISMNLMLTGWIRVIIMAPTKNSNNNVSSGGPKFFGGTENSQIDLGKGKGFWFYSNRKWWINSRQKTLTNWKNFWPLRHLGIWKSSWGVISSQGRVIETQCQRLWRLLEINISIFYQIHF